MYIWYHKKIQICGNNTNCSLEATHQIHASICSEVEWKGKGKGRDWLLICNAFFFFFFFFFFFPFFWPLPLHMEVFRLGVE